MLFTICIISYKYHKKFKSIFFTLKINSGSMAYLRTPSLLQLPTNPPVHSMSMNLSVSNFIQKNHIIFGLFHLLLYLWLIYAMIHSSIPFLLWPVICHCINILLGIHWLVDELGGSIFWILWAMWLWPFIMHKIGFKYNFHSLG